MKTEMTDKALCSLEILVEKYMNSMDTLNSLPTSRYHKVERQEANYKACLIAAELGGAIRMLRAMGVEPPSKYSASWIWNMPFKSSQNVEGD